MEVILCKLLPQFFLEKITSINENIFSFFYKRCERLLVCGSELRELLTGRKLELHQNNKYGQLLFLRITM